MLNCGAFRKNKNKYFIYSSVLYLLYCVLCIVYRIVLLSLLIQVISQLRNEEKKSRKRA